MGRRSIGSADSAQLRQHAQGHQLPGFCPTAVPGTSSFALTCTLGTTYTLQLDTTRSAIPTVGLAHSLSLNAAADTGNAAVRAYTVDISVDARQAGRCNASACSRTDYRTITISH